MESANGPESRQLELKPRDERVGDESPKSKSPTPIATTNALGQPNLISSQTRRVSTKADRQEIFLPVSGFVWLFPEEIAIVNHPAFQRLARIYQLGQSYVVFRGATHKRIEHVLGALHVVQRMIAAVQTNSEKGERDQCWAPPLNQHERWFVRLGTLLHDIGHMAAGHTVEDELHLVSKHDGEKRLELVLNGRRWNDRDGNTLGELIDKTYRRHVPPNLVNSGLSASTVVKLLIRKRPMTGSADGWESAQLALQDSDVIRLQICRDMIGNTICADLLDYIHRDWYHVGKPRPFDERLLQYMEIRRGAYAQGSAEPHSTDKFVISLGRRPKIRTDAVSNILDLLEWRYSLSETVLFHRTKLAASAMLDRALYEFWGANAKEDEIVDFLLPLSDEEMLSRCREKAEVTRDDSKSGKEKKESSAIAANLLGSLERRELFSHLSTRFFGDLPGDVVVAIKTKYAQDPKDRSAAPRNRNLTVRLLERDFGLPAGSIAMYCPAGVNRKIAEVQIAVGEEIERFCDYEDKHDNQLAGGHLDAQLRRFDRLWRVHFFIDRRVKASLGERLYLLQQAVDKLALRNLVDDEDGEHIAWSIAKWLVQIDGSAWKDRKVSDTVLSAKNASETADR